jgi:hypothetical protein
MLIPIQEEVTGRRFERLLLSVFFRKALEYVSAMPAARPHLFLQTLQIRVDG